MNELLGFDRRFALLVQECHLTRTTLLSGFDLLLKANVYQDKDGFFYSAFFEISIGLERLLKLAVITHHMLVNNYRTPTIRELRGKYGHDISSLHDEAMRIMSIYFRGKSRSTSPLDEVDSALVGFFSEYAVGSRYFNLNEICEAKLGQGPVSQWFKLAHEVFRTHTASHRVEKESLDIFYKMDREGIRNTFTHHKDESGQLLMVGDCLYRQLVMTKSAPLVIWRLIEVFRPVYHLLEEMSQTAATHEREHGARTPIIPHYEDFFYFFLATKSDIKRRKRWLEFANG